MRHRILAVPLVLTMLVGCAKTDDAQMADAEQLGAHQQWAEALEVYRSMLRVHPNSARAAEAQYKLAMIQYGQLKDIAGGARAFTEVVNRFPSSPEAPKACMVLGFLFAEEPHVRNLETARAWYERLVSQYPSSDLALGARQQLEHLAGLPGSNSTDTHPFIADTLTRGMSPNALAH